MNPRSKYIMALAACAGILLALSNPAEAQSNTSYGSGALQSGTTTGVDDSAFGFDALNHTTTGEYNTATGAEALYDNTGSNNTADGVAALLSNTKGSDNVAVGVSALRLNTTGTENTAIGYQALYNCTTDSGVTATGYQALFNDSILFGSSSSGNTADGYQALYSSSGYATFNTATGYQALRLNSSGQCNTADGYQALCKATNGFGNTATGCQALTSDTIGAYNLADGFNALYNNTSGGSNTAVGYQALTDNTVGSGNTAAGQGALALNTTGTGNTACGASALFFNSTGKYNTALGYEAGSNLTSGSNNIEIGDYDTVTEESDDGGGESNTIRIGETNEPAQKDCYIAGIENDTISGGAAVYITTGGLLGVESSSQRYKQDIEPMADGSDVLLSLKPVSFKYKPEIDPKGLPQFGLVAEDVEKACPGLVVHEKDGKPYTVRYEAVNAMLLNEFLKEHKRVAEQGKELAVQAKALAQERDDFQATLAREQQEIKSLTGSLKEQAAMLQKVSALIQLNRSAPEVVSNNR